MADLVWSDPDAEKEDFAISPRSVLIPVNHQRHWLIRRLLFLPHCMMSDVSIWNGLCRGAGYTFGSGVVHKFLETNNMSHILRAHQLCMEGYSSLFDKHLSTVWSAPNYCYRCGNSASILEVGPGESMYFNVFEAAPENDHDGPSQQASQNVGGKVRHCSRPFPRRIFCFE
jgi:serine/threonine-protein phosphatase PPG1